MTERLRRIPECLRRIPARRVVAAARAFASLTAICALAACASSGSLRPNVAPPPAAFAGADAPQYRSDPVPGPFWTLFGDPVLTELVQDGLAANHDLRIAAARVAETRALRREAAFDLGPAIQTNAGRFETRAAAIDRPGVARPGRDTMRWEAGFDATWEIDLFGRSRSALRAGRAEYGRAVANLDAALVSVTSEITRTYFELRGLQERLAVATRNVAAQQQLLDITRARLDAGRGTDFDVSRAQAQLATTQATVPTLRTAIARAQYRLAVLTARRPGELAERLAPQPIPRLPEFTPVGDPATWLRRRPDVRAAERELESAAARIGIATADLFPRVTLVGSFGYDAARRDALGERDAESYRFGPSITWGLLDLGHVQARIAASKARGAAAVARYEQAVLGALEDAEGSLQAYSRAVEREIALGEAASAGSRASELAKLRYEAGASDFLQVLDAERTRLEAEDRYAQSRADSATALVAVFKALGAGWEKIQSPWAPPR